MSRVVRVHAVGGPEVLSVEDQDDPRPGPGEVQLRQTAIGLNFIDVYVRTGLYPAPLPLVPGQEGVGVVSALGDGVPSRWLGARVGYAGVPGAYAAVRTLPVERLVELPEDLSELTAASVLLKGMTAEYLVRRLHPVARGEVVVVHAAAGGVGQLLCQWAMHLGAVVIGVVGSARKVPAVRASVVVALDQQPLVSEVLRLTNGRGADVVYDSVGKDTLEASLECLRPRGLLVSFGQSSGLPAPLSLSSLGGARSLFLTRPSLHAYIRSREELEASAAALFEALSCGALHVPEPRRFPLTEVAGAHLALERRQTTGPVVLLP